MWVQQALLFFCSLQLFVPMEADNWDSRVDPLSRTDGSFQKYSLNTTQIHCSSVRTGIRLSLCKQDSQPTLPELAPSSSLILDPQDHSQYRASKQIAQITRRFNSIQQMLLHHSEYESQLHEKRRGLRTMPIDWASLRGEYGNKMSIIGDIVELVEGIEREGSSQKKEQILDIKFQEYYLQRHYGALVCGEGNTSLQERIDGEMSQDEGSYLRNCESIINQERGGEEHQERESMDVFVEVPRFIEVEIPVLVYRVRQVIVRQEESEVASNINNIDSIINRFSRPYEDIYRQNNTLSPNANSKNSNIIASIMIDSNHRPKQTQIQLIYSDFPEQHQFKLPLDSFAQIQSLISHDGSSTGNNSRPPTQRQNYLMAINQQPLVITQKGASRSLLERIEENERILNEENLELKESVVTLQLRVEELQKLNGELQAHNHTLSHRLEEEIQQSQYYSSKLDEINAEVLQEKVNSLTHLVSAKDRKIESLTQDIVIKNDQLLEITRELAELQKHYSASQELLNQKDEEIDMLSKQIEEKEEQLNQLAGCEENVIQIAYQSQENMKRQIQKLQQQKQQLKQQLSQYSKRFKIEGISLQYEQAAQIQGIIENREHNYSLQILDLNKRYEEVITLYQDELAKLKEELEGVRRLSARVQDELVTKERLMRRTKEKQSVYATQFEKLIGEYEQQLEEKDNQILQLRKASHFHSEVESLFSNFSNTVSGLQGQLMRQRKEKADILKKIVQLDEIVRSQVFKSKQRDDDSQQRLIEELSFELEKKIREIKLLKAKLQESSQTISSLLLKQAQSTLALQLKNENDKLRKVNQKLKRYCVALQYQIKRVCGVDECQSHKVWVDNLIEQKNYFCSLLGGT